jgi:hypothetical protein
MERVTLPQRDGGINIWQSLKRLLVLERHLVLRLLSQGAQSVILENLEAGATVFDVVAASMFGTH